MQYNDIQHLYCIRQSKYRGGLRRLHARTMPFLQVAWASLGFVVLRGSWNPSLQTLRDIVIINPYFALSRIHSLVNPSASQLKFWKAWPSLLLWSCRCLCNAIRSPKVAGMVLFRGHWDSLLCWKQSVQASSWSIGTKHNTLCKLLVNSINWLGLTYYC